MQVGKFDLFLRLTCLHNTAITSFIAQFAHVEGKRECFKMKFREFFKSKKEEEIII